jgi:cellobiose phosphorylase
MYRVWIEDILGFQLRGSALTIKPSVPNDWPGYRLRYRYGKSTWRVEVVVVAAGAPTSVTCDGVVVANETITLKDDGQEHAIVVRWRETSRGKAIGDEVPALHLAAASAQKAS